VLARCGEFFAVAVPPVSCTVPSAVPPLRTTTFGGGQGGRSAEGDPVAELVADSELAAIAGSDWLVLGGDLASAAALQGAVFFALFCGLCLAAAGAFGVVEVLEAGGAGGLGCGALVLWAAGADESAGLT
jgi:hypothetical protein